MTQLDALREVGGYSPEEAAQRLVCVIAGEAGCGKTHTALTAPGPIAFFDIDHGTEGVIQKFSDDKEIVVIPIQWGPSLSQAEYREIWDDFVEKWLLAIETLKGTGGTIVLDTMTELCELAEWAFVGKLTEIPPTRHKQYQAPLRSLVRAVLDDSDLNAVFLHKWGLAYNSTTEYEIKGYKDMQHQVQAVFHVYIDPDNGTRMQECIKSRQNATLQDADPIPAMPFELSSALVWA